MSQTAIAVNGSGLNCDVVSAVARDGAFVTVTPQAVENARQAWEVVREVASRRPVYGRTTGVGANRDVTIEDDDTHGLRLLRSHSGGAGPLMSAENVRAMLVVRLNQIAAGGSGVDPDVLGALADVINRWLIPPIPAYGAIGTGDLTALASTALCLIGERPWQGGASTARFPLRPADALAFISSNAATLGEAALACRDVLELLRASIPVTGLALLAVRGSAEPYAAAVHEKCPHPGRRRVADTVRGLLDDVELVPSRIQDPYGYRAFPQVHGPAVDVAENAETIVTREINASSENPFVDVAGRTVWHNGSFHTAYVGLSLDSVRAAMFQTAALSAARLGTLVEPAFTGLAPFQAAPGEPGSGIMILEYVAHSAIADIRRLATPSALGNAVLSRGVEEHAGFSTQSARATTEAIGAYRTVLACELVAAVRALRMQDRMPPGRLGEVFASAAAVLDPQVEDRPLDGDIATATDLLPRLAAYGVY
ncbi:aromatic amino acid ammonia-lyase [Actinoallomurus iriomotensis]|uniref:aromatic amino acid ammonia-lyase n=1 Tax=Actinoallomurus iriomotensis TaxID=478107 RepID=UPI002557072F|nr:aromatic amino acid ammonia-lyase [Actinoallomurus iriomotensis]